MCQRYHRRRSARRGGKLEEQFPIGPSHGSAHVLYSDLGIMFCWRVLRGVTQRVSDTDRRR